MSQKITYKSSGVDIGKANAFIRAIGKDVKRTKTSGVIERPGSFGALYALDDKRVMVSSTDGVGTKLLIAQMANKHDTVGIDLVAMNVNDILCVGARPLFFLDYIACGKVKPHVLVKVVKGIADGCAQSGMSLIGGETAEMPGLYGPDEYDLAGFVVGVVEKKKIIDGSRIKAGDILIGLPSSGIHSNGYSLVRKVFSRSEQLRRAKELLTPTRIYAREVMALTKGSKIKGIAHITGGAFVEKLTKILPKGRCFAIDKTAWIVPKIFQLIQKRGKITELEMFKTFNMGIGMAMVVDPKGLDRFSKICRAKKIKYYKIGKVINHSTERLLL